MGYSGIWYNNTIVFIHTFIKVISLEDLHKSLLTLFIFFELLCFFIQKYNFYRNSLEEKEKNVYLHHKSIMNRRLKMTYFQQQTNVSIKHRHYDT